jgi:hypothetical protein
MRNGDENTWSAGDEAWMIGTAHVIAGAVAEEVPASASGGKSL